MYLKSVIYSAILLIVPFSVCSQSVSQSAWQQHVAYNISVTLDDKKHVLTGSETVAYTNNSPNTLTEIWFHLWPNAYKNRNTPFALQQLEQNKTDFYFAPDSLLGYIDGLEFRVNNIPVSHSLSAECEEYCRVILNAPLKPGETITISTPFRVKIPGQFSRLGHVRKDYQVTQWYPKPAVYDVNGWNLMPYLDQGEFYSEFGSFEVAITLPGSYAVAATGVLQNEEDRLQNSKAEKTLVWKQDSIHDFAWFANQSYEIRKDSVTLPNGHTVSTFAYYPPRTFGPYQINDNIAKALLYYSKRIGNYPYASATAVIGPLFAGGGMEYPMITICQKAEADVVVHEVGHNWFYGMLGSNERRWPWMDESINAYYEGACMEDGKPVQPPFIYRPLIANTTYWLNTGETYFLYLLQARRNEDQAVNLPAEDYTSLNYGASIYSRGPLLFKYLNSYLGEALFDSCMHAYFNAYAFKHPLPKDMQRVFESVSGRQLGWFFDDLLASDTDIDYKAGRQADEQWLHNVSGKDINGGFPEIKLSNNIRHKPLKIAIPGNFENPGVTQLNLCPVAAYNLYDNWQFGALLYNRLAPVKRTEFYLMPMYSTGSRTISGYGKLQWNIPVNNNTLYRVDGGISTATFSFKPEGAMTQYYRINPHTSFRFKERGRVPKRIFRSLDIDLTYAAMRNNHYTLYDTAGNPFDIPYLKGHTGYFGKLSYTHENRFVLLPYSLTGTLEYGKTPGMSQAEADGDYLKLTAELNLSCPYRQKNKKFRMRLFGGSFLYNNRTSGLQYFRVSGNTGAYDYLYQQTLIGRSENTFSDNIFNRQLIVKDGNLRTNAPSTLITNGWMLAGNFETTLPGLIPLRVYADAGIAGNPINISGGNSGKSYIGYAYTGGLSLVIRENVLEVYFPLVYSKNYIDYFNLQSPKPNFGQKICFRLNLNLLNPFDMVQKFGL